MSCDFRVLFSFYSQQELAMEPWLMAAYMEELGFDEELVGLTDRIGSASPEVMSELLLGEISP